MRICFSILAILVAVSAQASIANKVIAGAIANACFEQGNIRESGRAFDIGIGGQGWLPLLGPRGAVVYTRYGSFGMNADGDLIHIPSGLPLVIANEKGGTEKINVAQKSTRPLAGDPTGRKSRLVSMFFTDEGVLEGFYSDGQAAHLAKLTLAAFENERKLRLLDAKAHLFAAPKAVGEIAFGSAAAAPFGKVFARALEEVPADRYTKKCD